MPDKILTVFYQDFIQMYFTPEDLFNVFVFTLITSYHPGTRGISEKDRNRSNSTKVNVRDYVGGW